MTIQELIDELQKVPLERRQESILIFVNGCISGFLTARSVNMDPDENYICITSVRFDENDK